MKQMTDGLNYPRDAAHVRDLIREMLTSQVDQGSHMDTGGGLGSADLWVKIGGVEYFISVKPPMATPVDVKW